MTRVRLELSYELSDAPDKMKDCPTVCGRTNRPPADPLKGCDTCPIMKRIDGLDKRCIESLKRFCGEREDGTPNYDQHNLDELHEMVTTTARLDKELGETGYMPDADLDERMCLDIYRDEQIRLNNSLYKTDEKPKSN